LDVVPFIALGSVAFLPLETAVEEETVERVLVRGVDGYDEEVADFLALRVSDEDLTPIVWWWGRGVLSWSSSSSLLSLAAATVTAPSLREDRDSRCAKDCGCWEAAAVIYWRWRRRV
jgi:hypothetical protein